MPQKPYSHHFHIPLLISCWSYIVSLDTAQKALRYEFREDGHGAGEQRTASQGLAAAWCVEPQTDLTSKIVSLFVMELGSFPAVTST